jgi:zinc transporter ZupT
MIIVRYATLVALVLWLGAMLGARFGELFRRADLVAFGCGAATIVGLFILKFMGPPPRGFVARAATAALMLVIAAAASLAAAREVAAMLMTINITLGFVLLVWYVRE